MRRSKLFIFVVSILIITSMRCWALSNKEQPVIELQVKGPIIPIVADYIVHGIDRAEQKNGICLILLDTPGGLDKSMREIDQRILHSSVPVVIYVYPEGSRAASAGVYMLYAAHVAAMAPSTNLGSAHPVSIGAAGGEGKEDKTMMEKVTNDAVAYIKGLAKKRGRNVEWAEEAVRKSVSITSDEALQNNVIDIVAKDPADLLRQLKGRKVMLPEGEIVLNPSQSPPEKMEMTAVERFLFTICDPSIAVILMSLGLLGLVYELMQPGAVLPGIVGGICFILALYALGSLPINYAGLFLIIFAIILFIADIKAPTHGILTAGGAISLLLGLILLIPAGYPYFAISRSVIAGVTIIVTAFFAFVVIMVTKTLLRRPVSGKEGMVGLEGVAQSDISPEGTVRIVGELWNARSMEPVNKGEKVIVKEVRGLTVLVEKGKERQA